MQWDELEMNTVDSGRNIRTASINTRVIEISLSNSDTTVC